MRFKILNNLKQGYYNPKEHKPFVFEDARIKEIKKMLENNKNILLDDNGVVYRHIIINHRLSLWFIFIVFTFMLELN